MRDLRFNYLDLASTGKSKRPVAEPGQVKIGDAFGTGFAVVSDAKCGRAYTIFDSGETCKSVQETVKEHRGRL